MNLDLLKRPPAYCTRRASNGALRHGGYARLSGRLCERRSSQDCFPRLDYVTELRLDPCRQLRKQFADAAAEMFFHRESIEGGKPIVNLGISKLCVETAETYRRLPERPCQPMALAEVLIELVHGEMIWRNASDAALGMPEE